VDTAKFRDWFSGLDEAFCSLRHPFVQAACEMRDTFVEMFAIYLMPLEFAWHRKPPFAPY